MSEQEPQPAGTEDHCCLYGVVFVTPTLNASQLLILLFALFLVSLSPEGIPLHLFSCYVLHSVYKLANSIHHLGL